MVSKSSPATRARILVYLQENHVVSPRALSQAWGLTRADIRYHLHAMVEDGLIEPIPQDSRGPARRGRPEQLYRISAGRAPDNLAALTEALMDSALQHLSEAERDTFFTDVAGRLAGSTPHGEAATKRLNQAITYLDSHGYRARWEAHADGPRILLHNCPYTAILARHPELCILDCRLVERLVGYSMQQITQMNLETGKPPACIFITRLTH